MIGAVKRLASVDQVVAVSDCERPAPDRSSSVIPAGSQVYIRGWLLLQEGAAGSVRVDDRDLTPISGGLPRPDVAQSLGDDAAGFSGFEAFVETAGLAPGEHTIAVMTRTTEGHLALAINSTFTIGAPWPRSTMRWRRAGANVHFDVIQIGAATLAAHERTAVIERDDVVRIAGWSYNGLEKKVGVAAYAVIDNTEAIRLHYGRDRGDVAAAHGEERLRCCGFSGFLNLGAFGTGTHSVRVVILMEDGSAVAAEDSLALRVV